MLPENKWLQYGLPREESDIDCIVIHNTGNTELSARQLFDYLANECKTSQGCSYLVDHEEVIQVVPDTWSVYNTGKGKDYAFRHGIAIEICDNLNDELYQQGQDRAVDLIKSLMQEYSIGYDMIFFHQDFNDKSYCPHIIIDRYGSSKNFVYQEIYEENE